METLSGQPSVMRLTDQDASFLYAETASGPMHGATFSIIEGRVSTAVAKQHIASRIHLIPRLRQRLVYVPFNLAHPVWADDPKFDIDNHITAHHVQKGSTVEQAVAEGVELLQWLLPRDKPLWRMIVIEGVRNRTIIVQAAHHAMADGASGVDMSRVLFDLKANAPATQGPSEPWAPAPLPTALELTRAAIADNLQKVSDVIPGPASALSADLSAQLGPAKSQPRQGVKLTETLRRAGESLTRFVAQPIVSAPWNAGPIGPKRKLRWHQVPLADIREVRRALGGTINDVVLAVVAESAARYLADKNEAVKGKHLRVMCPVSVRTDDDQNALGNRVSAIFPITRAQPTDMVARLSQIRLETEQIKHSKEAHALDTLRETMPGMPAVMMAPTRLVSGPLDPTALAATFPPSIVRPFGISPPVAFNFTCTNVPGVQTAQYFAGKEVIDNLTMLMLGGNLGFGAAVGSYNQKLYFNFVAEPRLMPDVQKMTDLAQECFEELLASARGARQKAG